MESRLQGFVAMLQGLKHRFPCPHLCALVTKQETASPFLLSGTANYLVPLETSLRSSQLFGSTWRSATWALQRGENDFQSIREGQTVPYPKARLQNCSAAQTDFCIKQSSATDSSWQTKFGLDANLMHKCMIYLNVYVYSVLCAWLPMAYGDVGDGELGSLAPLAETPGEPCCSGSNSLYLERCSLGEGADPMLNPEHHIELQKTSLWTVQGRQTYLTGPPFNSRVNTAQ